MDTLIHCAPLRVPGPLWEQPHDPWAFACLHAGRAVRGWASCSLCGARHRACAGCQDKGAGAAPMERDPAFFCLGGACGAAPTNALGEVFML